MITAKDLKARTAPFLSLLTKCENTCNDRADRGYDYASVDTTGYTGVVINGVMSKLKTLGYKVELRCNNTSDLDLLYISWEDA